MSTHSVSRRDFVKASLMASAVMPMAIEAQNAEKAQGSTSSGVLAKDTLPTGKIAGQEFTRLMMGGNLISGWAHSRDLGYVSTLMRRYNTDAKIRETLELVESQGINAINTYVMDDNSHIFNHWKRGGKIKWFAQIRLDAGGGYTQVQKAIDEGATGVHVNGDAAEGMMAQGKVEKIGEIVRMIKAQKCIAGVAAHDLRVLEECEKLKLDVDFYQKTLHTHEYYTAPRSDEVGAMGNHDNSWCKDPQAVINFMANIKKPWIAFKILAAGALSPRTAFPYAFLNGADFILVGMFDWQVADNVKLARRVATLYADPASKRTRPWHS